MAEYIALVTLQKEIKSERERAKRKQALSRRYRDRSYFCMIVTPKSGRNIPTKRQR